MANSGQGVFKYNAGDGQTGITEFTAFRVGLVPDLCIDRRKLGGQT